MKFNFQKKSKFRKKKNDVIVKVKFLQECKK